MPQTRASAPRPGPHPAAPDRDRESTRTSLLQPPGVGSPGRVCIPGRPIAPPAAADFPSLLLSVPPSLPPFLPASLLPTGAEHSARPLLGRFSPWLAVPCLIPHNFGTVPFGVECSSPRTHGWGSEERAGPPKGRRLGGGDAAAVPGSPERAPLQRGHRERAALSGLPQHPVWLLDSAAQPRGEPMVSGDRLGHSRHPRAGREGCLRDSLTKFKLSSPRRRRKGNAATTSSLEIYLFGETNLS